MTVMEILAGIEDEQYIDICRKEDYQTFYYGPKRECDAPLNWFMDRKNLHIRDCEASIEGNYFDDATSQNVTMITF